MDGKTHPAQGIAPALRVGQVMGTSLMLGGLSLIAVVTGAITSAFVAHAEAERRQDSGDPVMQRLEHLSDQLEQIKAELADRPSR